MKHIIAIVNQKGGVGKSTTAHALGAWMANEGQRVLFADLDAQGNLSYTLGTENSGANAFDALTGAAPAKDTVQTAPGIGVMPSSPALAGADMALNDTGKEYRLKEVLSALEGDYDVAVIDTPPALGILTVNALTAATDMIIPAQADIYSLQGIGQLSGTLAAIRKYTNPSLKITGVLLTRYNPRAVLSRDIAELIEDTARQLDTSAFSTRIRECIAIKEAQANCIDIFSYAPRSNASEDYREFAKEVEKRLA